MHRWTVRRCEERRICYFRQRSWPLSSPKQLPLRFKIATFVMVENWVSVLVTSAMMRAHYLLFDSSKAIQALSIDGTGPSSARAVGGASMS